MDFATLRDRMVDLQIVSRGIRNQSVLNAFRKVERHRFVPKEFSNSAYNDHPLPIGYGQTISQPYMVALMTDLLNLTGVEKVLEIGTGSGYQAAILSELSNKVYSVEKIESLAEKAKATLKETGHGNIEIIVGDGSVGWSDYAPFDAVIVTASCPKEPISLMRQLADNGRLVAPVGSSFSQVLTLYKKKGKETSRREICHCVFVPLIGKEGWEAEVDG
ncbi:MAG: protein-L-isoaspartate(D-aspartate) O-methyltransferase [Candidatus Omnitrophica bacterium]|nr:protein-L-isoaspartate(D-aspartate) O-methyltransferase [Candidatus Omnitrophota bacterium]